MFNVVFISGVQQSDSVIYIVFFIFFSIMAYGKILNIVPSAIQQVLFAYFIYIYAHIYTPHLYPFICQWTFRLFPCLGCCKDLLS